MPHPTRSPTRLTLPGACRAAAGAPLPRGTLRTPRVGVDVGVIIIVVGRGGVFVTFDGVVGGDAAVGMRQRVGGCLGGADGGRRRG